MDITNIISYDMLEHITQELTTIIEDLWNKYYKLVNVTKKSKAQWNKECNRDLATYQISRRRIDQINYNNSVKIAKEAFLITKFKKLLQITRNHNIL